MHTFNDKVALITGGGTGIGAAVARKFVEAGGRVVLLGRRREPLDAVAKPLGAAAIAVAGDAADAHDVHRALDDARAAFGRVGVLVADAGGAGPGSAAVTSAAA
ncbi:3-oxoacyl-ACP reductase, partial [Burkholderia pseudomallei]